MIKKIVVVCTGNICRSPIAEHLLKVRSIKTDLEVISVGTHALVGQAADPGSVEIMRKHGYDITAHRAQQATSALLIRADLILTLDQTHTEWVITRLPELRGRVFSLGKWRGETDIADPYKQPREAFEKAYDDISPSVDDWLDRI